MLPLLGLLVEQPSHACDLTSRLHELPAGHALSILDIRADRLDRELPRRKGTRRRCTRGAHARSRLRAHHRDRRNHLDQEPGIPDPLTRHRLTGRTTRRAEGELKRDVRHLPGRPCGTLSSHSPVPAAIGDLVDVLAGGLVVSYIPQDADITGWLAFPDTVIDRYGHLTRCSLEH